MRETSWGQDYIKDRYDSKSKHNQLKSNRNKRERSWVSLGVALKSI